MGIRWWRVALAAASLVVIAVPARADVTQRPIGIDGDMLDWAPVLANPDNYVADLSIEQGDPDAPGSSDRDLRAFAFTWDATNLYFYFRRTFSANNSVTFLAYVDLNHDGVLTTADRIVRFDFNGSSASTRELRVYSPAAASDPITGDGVDEPGSAGSVLAATMSSASEPSGIAVEGSIAWASLGVAAGTPLRFHAACGSGMSLPGHVRDNTDAIDSQYAIVTLSSARLAAAPSPATVRLAHTLRNDGNGADTIDLNTPSLHGWSVALWTDPDGDGDPADGVLVAVDTNGDGDYSEANDTLPGMADDSNGNGLPDTGPIAPAVSRSYVIELTVPGGVANGTEETIDVLARSVLDLSVVGRNTDRVVVGPTTVGPDREQGGAPGTTVDAANRVCNHGTGADIVDLSVTSSLGWPVVLWSDPDGDGDPSDGAPLVDHDSDGLVDTDTLASGACVDIVARVAIPGLATPGTRSVATLTATSSQGYGSDTVRDGVTARARIEYSPDRAFDAVPGEVVYSSHLLINAGTVAESYDLAASTVLGSQVSFWTDPDCDGSTDDGSPTTTAGPIPPFGGSQCLVTQIRIPTAIAIGAIETVTGTARSQAIPALTDTVIDTLRAVHVRTYANPLLTLPSTTFYRCGTIYAGAAGLADGNEYRFVWSDADLSDGPERTSPGFTADDTGRVDDRYTILLGDVVGTWSVKIQQRQGSSWLDVTPQGSFSFVVLDETTPTGDIDALVTDRTNYRLTGDTVRVVSEVYNPSAVTFYRDTRLEYVVFRDSNGDGIPNPLETYIRADGTAAIWLSGATTHVRPMLTVFPVQRVYDSWQVTNVQFTASALWSVYMSWRTACNTLIDESLVDFSVGCFWKPTAAAGSDREMCSGGSATIGTPGVGINTYSWSPATGLSSASVAQPVASPGATTTYTVTVTDPTTACFASDSVLVTMRTPPAPDVTPDAPAICRGASIALDGGAGWSSWSWSTGDSSRSITVSPASTTTYDVTVTDGLGCAGTGSETVTVNPLPLPDISPAAPTICEGSPVTLDAGPGWSAHLWSTGDTTRTITVSPTTTQVYSVTVTDGNGCEGSIDTLVTVIPALTPDVTPDAPAVCPGASATLDAGAGYASYLWSTGDSTRTITVTPPATATYDVLVGDSMGCQATASETVTVRPLPAPDVLPDGPRICGGGSITLDAGPGFASYLWSTGDSTRTVTVTPALSTTYSVTVTDAFGCSNTSSETVLVDQIPEIYPPLPETCAGAPITLEAPTGYIGYEWSNGELTRTITVSPATTTVYDVTVTDVNGCRGSASITVTVHPLPTPAVSPGDIEVCSGTQVTLDAGAGYSSYRWLSGETTQTITVDALVTAVYTVAVGDGFGCEASASATVRVRPIPLFPPQTVALCAGDSRVLDAGAGFSSYLWSTGATTQTITVAPSANTTYSVTVTDAFGCSGSRRFDVVMAAPAEANAGPDVVTCAGIPVTLGSPAVIGLVYRWTPATGLDDATKAQPMLIATGDITYTLEVSDPARGGCAANDTVSVLVTPASPPDAMDNLLREVKSADGQDVRHSWAAKPGLQRYDLYWADRKDFSTGQTLALLLGEGTSTMNEAGAVGLPGLRYYRLLGSDCPFGIARREQD